MLVFSTKYLKAEMGFKIEDSKGFLDFVGLNLVLSFEFHQNE